MTSIPTYQEFMEPCLRALTDAGMMPKKEIIRKCSDILGLDDEQRQLMLESGESTVARSRISWALAYLKQAVVIHNPKRGHYQITERGRELLESPDRPIDSKSLEQFEEFQEFRRRSATRATSEISTESDFGSDLSPDEQLSSAARAIKAEVQSQLLEQLMEVDPARFEQIVVDLLRAIGYGVDFSGSARVVGGAGDGGIDGVIDEDVLGLDSIYLQAKRWQGSVGRPDVQAFAGALQGNRATKGVMITTSTFSRQAREYVKDLANSRIVLIDGLRLSGLMYDHGVGVANSTTVVTRSLDTDYFLTDN